MAVASVLAVLALLAQADVLPPVRDGLEPVPLPRFELLEAPVVEQLQAARQQLQRAAGRGGDELAAAYGSLGRICHAYEFFDSAEAAYRNAARLSPADTIWAHLLGALYQQTGRLEEAAVRFAAVLRVQPDHREAAVRLGEVFVGLNRLREAREQFQALVDIFPAVARNGLGEIALRERRFEDAIDHFEAVLARVPQAKAVHYSLAMAYRGLGRLDDARMHLQQPRTGGVRAADPAVDGLRLLVRGERALVLHGRRAYEAGQLDEALEAFSRAVAAAPDSATARANLGLVLIQQGRDAEAVEHLRIAVERTPEEFAVRRELAGALVRLRRDDEAIAVLGGRLDHGDEDAVVGLAILLADRQRYREAVALLGEAYARFPDQSATATTLARLLASAPDRSLRDGQRALDLALGVHAKEPAPAHAETVALALAELGRCAEAADWMRRAIEEAERVRDGEELARLRGELPKYAGSSCRR